MSPQPTLCDLIERRRDLRDRRRRLGTQASRPVTEREERAPVHVVRRHFLAALEGTYSNGEMPTVEDTQDVVERVLVRSGYPDIAKAFILYRHERARMRSRVRSARVENIPYKAMWQALDWSVDHGCNTVEGYL